MTESDDKRPALTESDIREWECQIKRIKLHATNHIGDVGVKAWVDEVEKAYKEKYMELFRLAKIGLKWESANE